MDYQEYLLGSLYVAWIVLSSIFVVDLLYWRCYKLLDR